MELRNISNKIIGVSGTILMPGDKMEITKEMAESTVIQNMVSAGRFEVFGEDAPHASVQPQAALENGKTENNPPEAAKANTDGPAAPESKPKAKASSKKSAS